MRLTPIPLLASILPRFSNRIAQDVAANYAGAIVNAVVPLLALPFLLRALGYQSWGVVSLATMLVAIMAIFNAGMAQSLIREFGLRWAEGEAGQACAARLLYAYQRVYVVGSVTIAASVLPFAGLIVSRWLILGDVPEGVAHGAIYCAIGLFVAQIPGSLYASVLMALQAQPLQNLIRSSATVFRGIGGVLMANATHSVNAYLVFITVAAILETLALRHFAWRRMGADRRTVAWDGAELRKSLRFSGKLSALVVLGVLTSQVDKIYLSYKLPIQDLGIYSIAFSIAMGVLQLSYPLFTAMLPRLVLVRGDVPARRNLNIGLLKLVAGANLFAGVVYLLLGQPLLLLWLGDARLATQVQSALNPLVLACALNTFYNIGYTNWVSLGETRRILAINLIGFVSAVFLTPIAIDALGLAGASVSLLSMNVVGAAFAFMWMAFHLQRDPKHWHFRT